MSHEETAHPYQHIIANLVAKAVVEFFEVINVNSYTSPGVLPQAPLKVGEITAVVAAGKRIANAQLQQLLLELLAFGDIHQDSAIHRLAGVRINAGVSRVNYSPKLAVRATDLEFVIAHRTIAIKQLDLACPLRRINQNVHRGKRLQFLN